MSDAFENALQDRATRIDDPEPCVVCGEIKHTTHEQLAACTSAVAAERSKQ